MSHRNGNGDFMNQFNGFTNNMNNGYNYNQAFNGSNTLIPSARHQKPNLVHDNLYDDILYEQVTEHVVHINSSHRNTTYYKNPLNFTISFNPGEDTPMPHINKRFRNVKYIKLHSIVMPVYHLWNKHELSRDDFINSDNEVDFTKTYIINKNGNEINIKETVIEWFNEVNAPTIIDDIVNDTEADNDVSIVVDYINTILVTKALIDKRDLDSDPLIVDDERTEIDRLYQESTNDDFYFDVNEKKWYIYRYDSKTTLYEMPHLIINIKELQSEYVHGTSLILNNSFGITRPVDKFNDYYFYGTTHLATRIFRDALMGTLNKFTFEFYTTDETRISFDHINKDAVSERDPRHPKYPNIQMQISFLIGEVEPTINQKPNFSR
jgi:hypothetical protein